MANIRDIPLRDRFREDRGGRGGGRGKEGRESRWGREDSSAGGGTKKSSSGANPPAGIPDEGGKNANLKPLGQRKAARGRGGGNAGETMQGELISLKLKSPINRVCPVDKNVCQPLFNCLVLLWVRNIKKILHRKAGSNGRHDCTLARHR